MERESGVKEGEKSTVRKWGEMCEKMEKVVSGQSKQVERESEEVERKQSENME